jgi:branched-chain amino acid transport system permease protein
MQIFANGLISGLTLALLAISFSTVYLPTRVFYLALGGIYTMVPFIALSCQQYGMPWFLASLVGVAAGSLLSGLCELLNHSRLEQKCAPPEAHMISSLGIYILLAQITALVWGNETKTLRAGIDTVRSFGEVILTSSQQACFLVPIILFVVFYAFLRSTNIGLHLRALADNPTELALRGYSINQSRLLCFLISGLFCATSSLLTAYDVGFDAHGGLAAILLAIVAVIVGGRSNFVGPLIGALVLGLTRSYVVWIWSSRWAEAVTFAFLALVLFLRPQGLIRARMRLESTP